MLVTSVLKILYAKLLLPHNNVYSDARTMFKQANSTQSYLQCLGISWMEKKNTESHFKDRTDTFNTFPYSILAYNKYVKQQSVLHSSFSSPFIRMKYMWGWLKFYVI